MIKDRLKKIIKKLFPPIIFDIKNTFIKNKPKYRPLIFFQKHQFKEKLINPWHSENWIKHVELKTNLTSKIPGRHIHIKALCNTIDLVNLLKKNKKKICILDIGGGTGIYYQQLINAFKTINFDKFIVYDSNSSINSGKKFYKNDSKIAFYSSEEYKLNHLTNFINDNEYSLIINISGTIHIIDDWKNFLSEVSRLNASAICITRLPIYLDASKDAYSIEDVTSHYYGYCGSTITNLFAKDSLNNYMKDINYSHLSTDYNQIGDGSYLFWGGKCPEKSYANVTLTASTYLNNNCIT